MENYFSFHFNKNKCSLISIKQKIIDKDKSNNRSKIGSKK